MDIVIATLYTLCACIQVMKALASNATDMFKTITGAGECPLFPVQLTTEWVKTHAPIIDIREQCFFPSDWCTLAAALSKTPACTMKELYAPLHAEYHPTALMTDLMLKAAQSMVLHTCCLTTLLMHDVLVEGDVLSTRLRLFCTLCLIVSHIYTCLIYGLQTETLTLSCRHTGGCLVL